MLLINEDDDDNDNDYSAQMSRPSSPDNWKTFVIPPTNVNPFEK